MSSSTGPSDRHAHVAAQDRPPWHGNWYREWRVGRFAFEIEWVPRARYYVFSFTINTPEKDMRRMEAEAGYPTDVEAWGEVDH